MQICVLGGDIASSPLSLKATPLVFLPSFPCVLRSWHSEKIFTFSLIFSFILHFLFSLWFWYNLSVGHSWFTWNISFRGKGRGMMFFFFLSHSYFWSFLFHKYLSHCLNQSVWISVVFRSKIAAGKFSIVSKESFKTDLFLFYIQMWLQT